MESISVIEAVRRAIDPWGMDGQHTTALCPTAAEVIDRLLSQGYAIVPHQMHSVSIDYDTSILGGDSWSCDCDAEGGDMYDLASHLNELYAQPSAEYPGDHDDCPIDIPHYHPGEISESEQRVLDGNR